MLERWIGNKRGFGLMILRLTVGVIFFIHGYRQIFSAGVDGIEETAKSYEALGIYYPTLIAWLVGLAESFGGFCLIVGFFTREAALLQMLIMIAAVIAIHGPNGFFIANNGYEYNLALIGSCLCLVYSGAGSGSLDAILFPRERWRFISDPTSIKLEPPSDDFF